MNCFELKIARQRAGMSQQKMAESIRKSLDSYSKKERGEVVFLPEEILLATLTLGLNYDQFNTIFFDGQLPFGNTAVV